MVVDAVLTVTPNAITCATPQSPTIFTSCGLADGLLGWTGPGGGSFVSAPNTAAPPDPSTVTLGCGTPFAAYPLTPF
jgi:hypothetical protein